MIFQNTRMNMNDYFAYVNSSYHITKTYLEMNEYFKVNNFNYL